MLLYVHRDRKDGHLDFHTALELRYGSFRPLGNEATRSSSSTPNKDLNDQWDAQSREKNPCVKSQPSAQLFETLILKLETKYNETAPFLDRLVIVTAVVLSCETLRATEQEENERVHE